MPMHREIMERVRLLLLHGSVEQRISAEIWGPVVSAHRPTGPEIGDPCAACRQAWPCGPVREILSAGLLPRL